MVVFVALGAVYLGVSFVERRMIPLLVLGLAGALLSVLALRAYQRHAGPAERRAV